MDLLELLETGDVEAFNDRRGERSRPDLFASDLAGKALIGVDLSGANVDKSDLTGADLSEANLYRASFTGIDGTGIRLCGAVAIKARFKEAYLDEADLTGADLSRADLAEANLDRSRGEELRLSGARLREVSGQQVSWPGVDLSEANLHKANLTGADLRQAILNEVSAAEAVLDGARLDGASGSGARLPSASLKGTVLSGARLPGANLAGADLTGADLSNADLSRANLLGAVLTGADLRGAVLADACLDGVDLTGLDLTAADLSGVDPGSVELSDAQRAQVAALGVQVEPGTPFAFERIDAARNGEHTALIWDNVGAEDNGSVRYAVLGGIKPVHGVIPVPAESVLARAVAPWGDGFVIVVIRERTGGVVSVVLELDRHGELGRSRVAPLGYEPAVRPVLRRVGDELLLWGLARRGPTLVVHRLTEEGMEPIRSEKQATAQDFLGKHHPILACKGGVLMPVGPNGAGRPLRTPDGFPGRVGLAVPSVDDGEERVCALWVEKRVGSRAGGLRAAWLAQRGVPEVEEISRLQGVTSIDAVAVGEHVLVAWIDAGDDGLAETAIHRVRLPGGAVETVARGLRDANEITVADGPGGPVLVVTTLDEVAVILGEGGEPEEFLEGPQA